LSYWTAPGEKTEAGEEEPEEAERGKARDLGIILEFIDFQGTAIRGSAYAAFDAFGRGRDGRDCSVVGR